MGVWRVGDRARAHSLKLPELRQSSLPFADEDVAGSPYAIADIRCHLRWAAMLHESISRKACRLWNQVILDFVPNHLGHDHPWIEQRPELFVHSRLKRPDTFRAETTKGPRWLAYGKDPYMGAWIDAVQLDYRNPATRRAMIEELNHVASLCDGVRCDMAMLVLNDVFAKTWQEFPSSFPPRLWNFWDRSNQAVRANFRPFCFWPKCIGGWRHACRISVLTSPMTSGSMITGREGRRRSSASSAPWLSEQFIARGHIFLENHDEPRVCVALSAPEHQGRCAGYSRSARNVLAPQGQLTGARQRLSVHLGRSAPGAWTTRSWLFMARSRAPSVQR